MLPLTKEVLKVRQETAIVTVVEKESQKNYLKVIGKLETIVIVHANKKTLYIVFAI